jgi:hypothetical protein
MTARTSRPRNRGKWFAGHAVLYFDESRRRQATFVVWENIYLVFARTPREAAKKAEALGRAECHEQGALKVDGKSARLAFGGIRRVVSCAANPIADDGVLTSHVPVLYNGAADGGRRTRGRRDACQRRGHHQLPPTHAPRISEFQRGRRRATDHHSAWFEPCTDASESWVGARRGNPVDGGGSDIPISVRRLPSVDHQGWCSTVANI